MGGRGSAGKELPSAEPGGGGGGGGANIPLDAKPGAPDTLAEALGKKGRPMSTTKAVAGANPFFDGQFGEYSENCQRAVIATEARFRGYDVIALPTYENDPYPINGTWKNFFKGAQTVSVGKTTPNATRKALEAEMAKYGNGARAIMRVQWKGKGANGHVINVVQRNGKTYYYDGQIGAKYDKPELLFNAIRTKDTGLVRVDNLEFSDEAREAFRTRPKG